MTQGIGSLGGDQGDVANLAHQRRQQPYSRVARLELAQSREALKTLRADMPPDLDARTIRPGTGVPPGTLGTAIDYRIRYHLAVTPSEDFVAAHGAVILLEQHLNEFEPQNPALWSFPSSSSAKGAAFAFKYHPSLADPNVAHLALLASSSRRSTDSSPTPNLSVALSMRPPKSA